MHLLFSSSELMLLQHNARQVTKLTARTSCYTERRFEISLYSWLVNYVDPIIGAMSTCRRGTGNTGKPLTGQFMNSKNWQAAHSLDMQVSTTALTHHPDTSLLTSQQSSQLLPNADCLSSSDFHFTPNSSILARKLTDVTGKLQSLGKGGELNMDQGEHGGPNQTTVHQIINPHTLKCEGAGFCCMYHLATREI